MKNSTSQLIKFILITVLISLVTIVQAQTSKSVSLEDASKSIQSKSNGKILSAKTSFLNNQKTHKIKVLLPSGRIKVYQIPANKSPRKQRNQQRNDRYQSNDYRQNQSSQHHNNQRSNAPTRQMKRLNPQPRNTTTNREKQK